MFFDVLGNIFFFRKKLRNRPAKLRKVLFIRLEHIGDMVMATPVFHTFKKNRPECELHVLCRSLTKPIIESSPDVDKIITYDAPWFSKRGLSQKTKFSDIVRTIRKEKYDMVFEMHGDPRNILIASKSGSYALGFGCRGTGFLLNELVGYNEKIHTIDRNLDLIRSFCKKIYPEMVIYTNKKAVLKCRLLMKEHDLQKRGFIIINPRSGRPEKDLSDEEVLNFIEKNRKTKTVITGSRDGSVNNLVFSKTKNVVNLTGRTDIQTLIELVRNAQKVIAPDTGIVHIAKAVGTKYEVIYKTTDSKIWGYK